MSKTITATFDGRSFVPDEPPELAAGTVVRIEWRGEEPAPAVDEPEPEQAADGQRDWVDDLLEYIDSIPAHPDTPTDLAAEHDHYLYGTPKRGDR